MSLFHTLLCGSQPLAPGSAIPKLSVTTEDGVQQPLGVLLGEDLVLLYFYPKAGTHVCSSQACGLRDNWEALLEVDLRVVGASIDSVTAQKKFRERDKLPFPLIADHDAKLASAFGVACAGFFAMRSSFLIRDGRVVKVFTHAAARSHAAEVLRAVWDIQSRGSDKSSG